MEFKVKDISLANKGALLVDWASAHMPVLNQIKRRFEQEQPLKNVAVGACLHVTKETAVL
ncbi:adenosylhomocysteinase, partial [Candidatus Bathyarchaeota archaeon]|nr:adenosylhomocysteinase [Candidatus Bathyarchaeota archaeon]